jgi:ribosomal protein S27AE
MKKYVCPHCGNDDVFIAASHVSGRAFFEYSLNGTPVDNSLAFAQLNHQHNKFMICGECENRAMTITEFQEMQDEMIKNLFNQSKPGE